MFYFLYISFVFFLCITIWQLIKHNLFNEDFMFLVAVNYLLNITTALFLGYYYSLIWSFISASFLIIFATILYYKMIVAFQKFKFFPLPYLTLMYFIFFLIFFLMI